MDSLGASGDGLGTLLGPLGNLLGDLEPSWVQLGTCCELMLSEYFLTFSYISLVRRHPEMTILTSK